MKRICLLLIPIFFFVCGCYEFAASVKKNVSPMAFSGIVSNKFVDSSDRMAPMLTLLNGDSYPIYAYEMYDDLRPGDSIIKEAGNLKYILKRKGENPKEYYPKCDGKEIK